MEPESLTMVGRCPNICLDNRLELRLIHTLRGNFITSLENPCSVPLHGFCFLYLLMSKASFFFFLILNLIWLQIYFCAFSCHSSQRRGLHLQPLTLKPTELPTPLTLDFLRCLSNHIWGPGFVPFDLPSICPRIHPPSLWNLLLCALLSPSPPSPSVVVVSFFFFSLLSLNSAYPLLAGRALQEWYTRCPSFFHKLFPWIIWFCLWTSQVWLFLHHLNFGSSGEKSIYCPDSTREQVLCSPIPVPFWPCVHLRCHLELGERLPLWLTLAASASPRPPLLPPPGFDGFFLLLQNPR